MAELLRDPWLGNTIEKELSDVLEGLGKSEANRSQGTGKIGDLCFADDGSNLRIRSARPRIVQIVKVRLSTSTTSSIIYRLVLSSS